MIITHKRERIDLYIDYIKKDIDRISQYIASNRKVTQIHWGGGTPSYLSPSQIRDLLNYTYRKFTLSDDAEVSMEVDPRGLTFEHLEAARDAGFNRISMGVQDFNLKVQKVINRIQPEALTREIVDFCRQLNFQSINIDLIYGLPYQTLSSFEETVDKIIDISPDRIALFNYAHVPWMKKHQVLIKEETLPQPQVKLNILKMAIEKLTDEGGYRYIGMDHFTKPHDELSVAQDEKTLYRNFQGYSTRAGADLYALGISGISQTNNVYAQNVKDLKSYYALIDNKELAVYRGYQLTEDDHIRRYVIMRLMCDFELNKKDTEVKFNIKFDDYFHDAILELEAFKDDNLIKTENGMIYITDKGRLLVRNVAMLFDKYLKQPKEQETPVYSRTV